MRIKILGSAAGGGFPQWNCSCHNCRRLRQGKFQGKPQTQTQIAFSPDGKLWFLVGASPDLRTQILATPELAPSNQDATHSPIAGIFLQSADVDSIMGLLHLREFQIFFLFATASPAYPEKGKQNLQRSRPRRSARPVANPFEQRPPRLPPLREPRRSPRIRLRYNSARRFVSRLCKRRPKANPVRRRSHHRLQLRARR